MVRVANQRADRMFYLFLYVDVTVVFCISYRMFRVLADGDIENCLEEIPSDDDRCCSAESDQETHDAQPPTMLLGDVVGERLQSYSFDEEDSEPLSSLRSTLPPEKVATDL